LESVPKERGQGTGIREQGSGCCSQLLAGNMRNPEKEEAGLERVAERQMMRNGI
jgi:hypothetical protein